MSIRTIFGISGDYKGGHCKNAEPLDHDVVEPRLAPFARENDSGRVAGRV